VRGGGAIRRTTDGVEAGAAGAKTAARVTKISSRDDFHGPFVFCGNN
jgi:hypothetical protein